MKKLLLCCAVVLALGTPSWACMNGFSEIFNEKVRSSKNSFPLPNGHPVNTKDEEVTESLRMLEKAYAHGNFEFSIDYGLFLVYDKQYEEAEKVFRKIVAKWPDKYEAAANFGTILEVNGKNEEALKWIKKAIKINPNSHDGSEWLHVNILEAKLHPEKKWSGATLTGWDFGTDSMPSTQKNLDEIKTLQKQLFFQLNERVTFIQPKDPFIAALMFELGNVTLARGQHSKALSIYKKAKKYGFEEPLITTRMRVAGFSRPGESQTPVAMDTITHDYSAETIPAAAIPKDSAATTPSATSAPMGPLPSNPTMLIVIVGGLIAVVASLIFFLKRAAK